MKRYFLTEIENMRDIGGYPIDSLRYVAEGKIIRSNLPISLSQRSLLELIKRGYDTVIDFRSDEELEINKSIFWGNDNFKYNHIKINGNGRVPESKEDVLNSYIEMLEGKEQIKKVFNVIAEAKGGVIYYCTAGKDRTGVITALILKLLGVDDKDIVVDYVVSGIYIKEMIQEFAEKMKDKKDIFEVIKPKDKTMFDLLEYIANEYDSVEKYLISCGVEEKEILKIKNKYIVQKNKNDMESKVD